MEDNVEELWNDCKQNTYNGDYIKEERTEKQNRAIITENSTQVNVR